MSDTCPVCHDTSCRPWHKSDRKMTDEEFDASSRLRLERQRFAQIKEAE